MPHQPLDPAEELGAVMQEGRFFIFDPDLQSTVGHSFQASVRLAETGIEAGMQPLIFGNRHFSDGPVSVLGGRATIIPFFKAHAFDFPEVSPGGARLRALYDDEPALEEWELYLKKLLEIDAQYHINKSDVIYAHTLSHPVAIGWLYFLLLKAPEERPTIYGLIYAKPENIQGVASGSATILDIFSKYDSEGLLYRNIFFHTETVRLHELYKQKGFDFPVFMGPIPQNILDSRLLTVPETTTISYLGEAREEKGFTLLPDILEILLNKLRGEERAALRFKIQISANGGNNTAPVNEARARLAALARKFDNVELLSNLLTEEYDQVIRDTDVALLPYDPRPYHTRGSGVAFELLAAGKVVVCHADTDIAATFSRDHVLVANEYTADDFARAILFYLRLPHGGKVAFRRGATDFEIYGIKNFLRNLKAVHAEFSLSAAVAPVQPRRVCLYIGIAQFAGGNGFIQRMHIDALRKLGFFVVVVGMPWFFENAGYFAKTVPTLMTKFLTEQHDFHNTVVFCPIIRDDKVARGVMDKGFQTQKFEMFSHPVQCDYFEHLVNINSTLGSVLKKISVDVCVSNYTFMMPFVRKILPGSQIPIVLETHDYHFHQNRLRRAARTEVHFDAEQDERQYASDLLSEMSEANHAASLLHISDELQQQYSECTGPRHLVMRPYLVQQGFLLPPPDDAARPNGDICAFCQEIADPKIGVASSPLVRTPNLNSIDLLFYGSPHPANAASFREFVDAVFRPLLRVCKTRLFVAGDICELVERQVGMRDLVGSGDMILLGRVGDIMALIDAARIVVLYVSDGTGFPTRVVEVLGRGQAFTINRRALPGVETDAEPYFNVCADPDAMVQDICMLLASKESRVERGAAGLAFSRAVFSEQNYLEKFAQAVGWTGSIPVTPPQEIGHRERIFSDVDREIIAVSYYPIELGQDCAFSSSGIPSEFLLYDWSRPEESHTWIEGKKGVVLFRLDPNGPPLGTIIVRLSVLSALIPQRPKVSVIRNGSTLFHRSLKSGYEEIEVYVPPAVRSPAGLYQMELVCSETGQVENDPRDLSLSVSSFACYPVGSNISTLHSAPLVSSEIIFGSAGNANVFVERGINLNDLLHSWTTEPTGSIVFRLENGTRIQSMSAVCRTLHELAEKENVFSIAVNGTTCYEGPVSGGVWETIDLDLGENTSVPDGFYRIEFRASELGRVDQDDRDLAWCIRRLEFGLKEQGHS